MPEIFVWAVVTSERGVLLVPAHAVDGWMLPGGPLQEDDDSVEVVLMRELERTFGASPEEVEFFDTAYERLEGGETVVHNLFLVPGDLLGEAIEKPRPVIWLDADRLEAAPIPDWLRAGLAPLFGGAEAEASFSMDAMDQALARFLDTPPVFIVTGPAGAGKTTVARALCDRFERTARIEVDLLRAMVRAGHVSAVPGDDDLVERALQLSLARHNAAALAQNFVAAGFTTVIDDVLEQPAELDELLEALGPATATRVITLLPDVATLHRRDQGRPAGERMGARCTELHAIISANGETRGLRLDTSTLTPEEAVDQIIERMDETRLPRAWDGGEETR